MLKQMLVSTAMVAFGLVGSLNAKDPNKRMQMHMLQVPGGELADAFGATKPALGSIGGSRDSAPIGFVNAPAGGPPPLAPHSAEVP